MGKDIDFTEMTDEEVAQIQADAGEELGKRQSKQAFDAEIADVVRKARGHVIPDRGHGEPWEPVTSYENVYFKGDIVTHKNKTWQSNIDNNAGEPGVSGWREQVEDNDDGTPNYPVWQHNGHSEDNWEPGAIVWFPNEGDQLFINVHNQPNGWSPDTPGGQWEPWDGEQQ